jgi:integrase
MGKLTAARVKNAKPGEKLTDGDGLRLDVDGNGNASWTLRFTSPVTGKERQMGLGPARDVTLAEARDLAADARKLIRSGVDPINQKREARASARVAARRDMTFRQCAERFVDSREATWKNPVHRQQWKNSLRDYVYPVIGSWPVADVDVSAVLKILEPIWNEKPETASRIRGRIEAVLDWATMAEYRSGDNPAVWRGRLAHLLPSRKKVRAVVHHPALPYVEMPKFWKSLSTDTSDSAALLQFIILTGARFSEAARAEWSEIDTEKQTWTVPAVRMKGGREHVVPLTDEALAVLKLSRTKAGLIFPGQKAGRPISDVSVAKAIKRHTALRATCHGMRSAFRDFAGDATDVPREIAEAALAHAVGNEVEAAYRRSSAIEKRRALMVLWSRFCCEKARAVVFP